MECSSDQRICVISVFDRGIRTLKSTGQLLTHKGDALSFPLAETASAAG